MSIVNTGWLNNEDGEKFAPKTLVESIQNKEGKTLQELLNEGGGGTSNVKCLSKQDYDALEQKEEDVLYIVLEYSLEKQYLVKDGEIFHDGQKLSDSGTGKFLTEEVDNKKYLTMEWSSGYDNNGMSIIWDSSLLNIKDNSIFHVELGSQSTFSTSLMWMGPSTFWTVINSNTVDVKKIFSSDTYSYDLNLSDMPDGSIKKLGIGTIRGCKLWIDSIYIETNNKHSKIYYYFNNKLIENEILSTDVFYDDTETQIGVDNIQDAIKYLIEHGGSGGGSSSGFNIEEIFKANSIDEFISEGGTITLPKNYDKYDQIVLGIGTKGDGFGYGLGYFYLYPKTSNIIHFAGYSGRWGTATFENNICTLSYGRQVGESSDRAFCIASLYGVNFGSGGSSGIVDTELDENSNNPIANSIVAKLFKNSFYNSENSTTISDVNIISSSSSNNYSTEEHKVGTWIDGSDIYEKTYCPVTSGILEEDFSDKEIIESHGYMNYTNNNKISVGNPWGCIYKSSANKLIIEPNGASFDFTYQYNHVTVRYIYRKE